MSVLIESLSVVLDARAVLAKFPGSFEGLVASLPPGTICADGELVRVGFLRAPDALDFIARLEQAGFVVEPGAKDADVVVADVSRGLLAPCGWAEFARVSWSGAPLGPVAICKRRGTPNEPIVTPEGWEYQSSLSKPPEWVI